MNRDETITIDAPRGTGGPPRLWIGSAHEATVVELPDGARQVIGRGTEAQVRLTARGLSKRHAAVEAESGVVRVRDLGSKNGTFVRGVSITAPTVLALGDELRMGDVWGHLLESGGRAPLLAHGAFVEAAQRESVRARFSGRPVSVAVIRRHGQTDSAGHAWLSDLATRFAKEVPTVAAAYSASVLELLLVAHSAAQSSTLIERVLAEQSEPLWAGVSALSGAENLEGSIAACMQEALRGRERSRVCQIVGGAGSARYPTSSEAMERLWAMASKVAATDVRVLIGGETGAGKEVLARAIHQQSHRSGGPFVALNCGALPPALISSELFGHRRGAFTGAEEDRDGVFVAADGGTLMLDEVGELPAEAQVALLRVLEEREVKPLGAKQSVAVDVRLIAATHRDLQQMVAEGDFRQDLLFRLDVVSLAVPPLRERKGDIPKLARLFLHQVVEAHGLGDRRISSDTIELLSRYHWPGNVRELRNTMERAALLAGGSELTPDDLPPQVVGGEAGATTDQESFRGRLQRYEAELIAEALREVGYNQSEAARRLHMPLRTMVRKIKAYGLGRRR